MTEYESCARKSESYTSYMLQLQLQLQLHVPHIYGTCTTYMVHVPHIRYMYHAPDKSCSGFFCLPGYCSYLDFASLLPLLSLKDPSVCTVEANNQKSPSSFRQCCSSTSMLFKLLNSMFLPSMSFIGDAFMLFKPFKKWFRNEKRDQGSPQTDQ